MVSDEYRFLVSVVDAVGGAAAGHSSIAAIVSTTGQICLLTAVAVAVAAVACNLVVAAIAIDIVVTVTVDDTFTVTVIAISCVFLVSVSKRGVCGFYKLSVFSASLHVSTPST